MFGRYKNFLLALSVLVGAIVGAGIFGIPYVVAKSGLVPALFYFLILGGAIILIHLFFGEVVLRTKEKHRLIGYAEKYLGKWGKFFVGISVIVGLSGALLAYLILGGQFLTIIFSSVFNLSSFHFSLLFWLVLSYFVFRGIKLIAPIELFTNLFFFLAVFVIFFFCFPKIDFSNFIIFDLPNIFLPYGVILFSLLGLAAIPEALEVLKIPAEKKGLKKIIILATFLVVILYIFFALGIAGVTGANTSPDALSGLVPYLGKGIIFWGALAGVITLADSFLILGLSLRNSFIYDFGLPRSLSCSIALGLPLILFLAGFRSFIEVIGIVGIVIGMIEGGVVVLLFKKAKELGDREPEYSLKVSSVLLYCLIGLFILGAISQLLKL